MTPSWLRAISLLLFVASAGTSLTLLFFAVMEPVHSREQEATMLVALTLGCGSLGLSLFFLIRSLRRTYRSIWGSFARPVLMLLCAQCCLTFSMLLANLGNPREEAVFLCLALIVFPGILFLVLFFLRDRAIRGFFPGANPAVPPTTNSQAPGVSKRKWTVALGLSIIGFFGPAGLHRFYVGKIGTGLLWLFTGGLFLIGTIIDLVHIAQGEFRDKSGRLLLDPQDSPSQPASPATMQPVGAAMASPNTFSPPMEQFVPRPTQVQPAQPQVPFGAGTPSQPALPYSFYHASRQERISRLLTFLGGLLLIAAAACVLAGVILPWAITAGFPDGPQSAADMTRAFGTPNWPPLMAQLGTLLGWAIGLLGLAALIVARRHAGLAHIARAVLTAGVISLSLIPLSDVIRYANYEWVAGHVRGEQGIGPAFEAILNPGSTTKLIVAGLGMIVAVVLVSWPARRREAGSTLSLTGGGSTL